MSIAVLCLGVMFVVNENLFVHLWWCSCILKYTAKMYIVSSLAVSFYVSLCIQFMLLAIALLTNCLCMLSQNTLSVGIYKQAHLGSSQIHLQLPSYERLSCHVVLWAGCRQFGILFLLKGCILPIQSPNTYFESNNFSDTLKLELIDLLRHVKHVSCSLFYGNTLLPFVFSVCVSL